MVKKYTSIGIEENSYIESNKILRLYGFHNFSELIDSLLESWLKDKKVVIQNE